MATEGLYPEMDSPALHRPVLAAEALRHLNPRRDGVYLDATLGDGGHAAAILESSSPTGRVFGIDLDPRTLTYARQRLSPYGRRFDCAQGNYADMLSLAQAHGLARIDGLIMDLGFSSRQVQQPGYGFSFLLDEPLDMRFDPASALTAEHVVNTFSERDLAQLIFQYGQEPRSRAVARAVIRSRPINSTGRLAELVAAAVGHKRGRRLHPATRTFQALRIAVNDELGNLQSGLDSSLALLSPGGALVVISYHSLEDRMVKNFIARERVGCICPPGIPECRCGRQPTLRQDNRRIIRPSDAEIASNPRSRSARMRVAWRL